MGYPKVNESRKFHDKENWIEILHLWKELKTKQLGMNEEINKLIDALPPNKQLLFGVCCVKRIENCLYKFLKNKEEEPAAIVVEGAIDRLFKSCVLAYFANSCMIFSEEVQAFVEYLIPDTDADGSNEALYAQNAAIALAYCIRFTKEQNDDFIHYCALKILETIDVMAFDISDNERSNILVLQETATQKRIIKLIDAMPNNFDFNEIEALKETIAQFSID